MKESVLNLKELSNCPQVLTLFYDSPVKYYF